MPSLACRAPAWCLCPWLLALGCLHGHLKWRPVSPPQPPGSQRNAMRNAKADVAECQLQAILNQWAERWRDGAMQGRRRAPRRSTLQPMQAAAHQGAHEIQDASSLVALSTAQQVSTCKRRGGGGGDHRAHAPASARQGAVGAHSLHMPCGHAPASTGGRVVGGICRSQPHRIQTHSGTCTI